MDMDRFRRVKLDGKFQKTSDGVPTLSITFLENFSLFDTPKPIQIHWGVNFRGTKFFLFSIKVLAPFFKIVNKV